MMKKRIYIILLAIALILGTYHGVWARSFYLPDFNTRYGTSGTALDTCGVCHNNPAGGGARNPYGLAYQNTFDFALIEALDSDEDGFSNLAEIEALTFPGDSNSKPAATDTTPPSVTGFTIPATSNSLTVAINTFTASDDVAVTGYMVTETSTAPAANDTGWGATAPANHTFATAGAKTLYAWAKDAAGNVSVSVSANVTITIADTTAPTVTDFVIPATSNSLTVAITTFTATDDVEVTGYLVTEMATAPTAADLGWSDTAPADHAFAAAGAKTLFAWAKDAAGNVSVSVSAEVTIASPGTLTVGSVSAQSGGQITVPISVSDFTSIAAFNITVLYDPEALQAGIPNGAAGNTYVDRLESPTADYDLFAVNADVVGKIELGGSTLTPTTTPGVFINVLFTVKPTFTGTTQINLTILDDSGNDVRGFAVVPGEITVYSPIQITHVPLTTKMVAGGGSYQFMTSGGAGMGNMLSFSLQGPAGGSINSQTGEFTMGPQNSAGKYTLTVTDHVTNGTSTLDFVVHLKVDPASVMHNKTTLLAAGGGTGSYFCTAGNTGIVNVESAPNGCSVTGLTPGIANITVRDTNDANGDYAGTGRIIVFQGGTINGTIVDSNAALVEGATIRVMETGDVLTAQDGSFQLDLHYGWHTLSFSAANKATVMQKVNLNQVTLNVDPVILADATESISGTVEDLAGAGVQGAEVIAIGIDDQGNPLIPRILAIALSDAQGNFTLSLTSTGSYRLVASKTGYGNSAPQTVNTGVNNATLTLNMVVNSFESGDPRTTTVQIIDKGVLTLAPTITVIQGQGGGSLTQPAAEQNMWEATYTPDPTDADGALIGIKIEPLGPEGGISSNYFFTVHPDTTVAAPTKVVQTIFTVGITVVGQPVGQVMQNGQVVDANDGTSFVVDPDHLSTQPGAIRSMEVTRFEVENSSAQQAIRATGVTPMSAVYDFAFVDPDTGEETGAQEVTRITLRIKVDLAVFDPNNWAPMISHDPTGPSPVWQFAQPVPGSVSFDGQYISFDLTTLYGQGVVITTPPDQQAPDAGGVAGGGGGGCFISAAVSGPSQIESVNIWRQLWQLLQKWSGRW